MGMTWSRRSICVYMFQRVLCVVVMFSTFGRFTAHVLDRPGAKTQPTCFQCFTFFDVTLENSYRTSGMWSQRRNYYCFSSRGSRRHDGANIHIAVAALPRHATVVVDCRRTAAHALLGRRAGGTRWGGAGGVGLTHRGQHHPCVRSVAAGIHVAPGTVDDARRYASFGC